MRMRYHHVFYALFTLFALLGLDPCDAASRVSKCKTPSILNGRVRTRSRGRMAKFRCKSGFKLFGPKHVICLATGLWNKEFPVCVGRGCPKINVPADVIVSRLYGGAILNFNCKMGLTRIGPDSIKCDGSNWDHSPPQCLSEANKDCDFEDQYLCGWSNDVTDDFDWTWLSGKTPTADTGPSTDHTTQNETGHYVFIESSSPQKDGDAARLLSPVYKPDQLEGVCFQFWYHMFGGSDGVGNLNLFLTLPKSIDGPRNFVSLFSETGNKGDQWLKEVVTIPQIQKPMQFVFEARRRRSWTSDIALDDIRMFNCSDEKSTSSTTAELIPQETSSSLSTTTITLSKTTITTTSTTTTPPTTTTSTTTTTIPTTTPSTTTTTSTTTTSTTAATPTTTTSTTTTTPTTTISTTATRPTTTTATTTPTTTTIITPTANTPTLNTIRTTLKRTTTAKISTTITQKSKYQSKTTSQPTQTTTTTHKEREYQPNHQTNTAENSDLSTTKTIPSIKNTNNSMLADGANLQTGGVKSGHSGSGDGEQTLVGRLPLILGVAGGVFLIAVVISAAAYALSRRKRMKQRELEEEDQMKIISDIVESSLNT